MVLLAREKTLVAVMADAAAEAGKVVASGAQTAVEESGTEVAAWKRLCRKAFVFSASSPATTFPTRMLIVMLRACSTHLIIFVR